MRFFVETEVGYQGEPTFIIRKQTWNDWFKWLTLYDVQAVMPDGQHVNLGLVKIGRKGMTEENGSTQLLESFNELEDAFFSLGQDENYYETLMSLGDDIRVHYLDAMRDCAFRLEIFSNVIDEPVLRRSLIRDIDASRVRERFHRLALGQAVLTAYSFSYQLPVDAKASMPPPLLSFSVSPNSLPATNIHVLIGRNGVGKTRCFDLLARAFLQNRVKSAEQDVGTLRNMTVKGFRFLPDEDLGFAGLVTMSFSAFDSRGPLAGKGSSSKRYAYIGLVTYDPPDGVAADDALPVPRVKTPDELAKEFAKSVLVCREGVRCKRWRDALTKLEADPLFAEINVSALATGSEMGLKERAQALFSKLSSGHSVVLLSITRLVEVVEETSLVLIDEPESHLHPPLLSAFVRSLSDLLINRNGVAIVATHSPVVLQEVPASCVWKLGRAGHETRADRPELETFGENVGVLTREVFGLEVTQTGFHRLIAERAISRSYEELLADFGGGLGAEGRSLARALSLLPPEQQVEGEED